LRAYGSINEKIKENRSSCRAKLKNSEKVLTLTFNYTIIQRHLNNQEEKKMSTYLAKPTEVERSWYVIDAAGKPLGRVASQAATLLRGKNKPTFTPNVDCGDHVIIINCKDAVLTGNKLTQKKWQRHTGYVGHLKETRYDTLMATRPTKAMELAVKGMLPKNTLGRKALLRLRLFEGAEHNHQAQKPEMLDA
jgi:large subunit ribosomal protein L13